MMSIINTPYVKLELLSIYQGIGFANFGIFQPVINKMIPDAVRNGPEYNDLDYNFSFHPYIFYCIIIRQQFLLCFFALFQLIYFPIKHPLMVGYFW